MANFLGEYLFNKKFISEKWMIYNVLLL